MEKNDDMVIFNFQDDKYLEGINIEYDIIEKGRLEPVVNFFPVDYIYEKDSDLVMIDNLELPSGTICPVYYTSYNS